MVPEEILERAAVDDVSPRYLRKQKPAASARRRPRQARSKLRRGTLALLIAVVACGAMGAGFYLLFDSPVMRLRPGRLGVTGTRYVSQGRIRQIFAADMGQSVIDVPLAARLAAIEQIPWVRSAVVERVLPDRLDVTVVERTPVAFLSTNTGMKLIDADGVILDRPPGAHFNLPVVTGLGADMPTADRVARLAMFSEFMKQIATVKAGADGDVSEVNLSNPDDVQATMTGLAVLSGQGPVVVHFGKSDFAHRFRLFLANFPGWQQRAGNVEAVDLRYAGEALVTPETPFSTQNSMPVVTTGPGTNTPTPPLSALISHRVAGETSLSVSARNLKGSARN